MLSLFSYSLFLYRFDKNNAINTLFYYFMNTEKI